VKLTDLQPRWVRAGGEGTTDAAGAPVPERLGVGVSFECPCGCGGPRVYVQFSNPLDGGPPVADGDGHWARTGETFETLDLQPSIQRLRGCRWHGFVRNGEIVTV
jgi:hypothetical protein